MYEKPAGTVVFSGRFDRPHIGHVAAIVSLGQVFNRVLVPVLDYPEQHYPVAYRHQVLQDILSVIDPVKYQVTVNRTHFGMLTKEEWNTYHADWYASGNWQVLAHVETLGVRVLYVGRKWGYASSDEYRARDARVG
jgi:hypothetical protein